jgi:hypothetical protein
MGVPGVWADCSTCMFVGGGGCVTVARQDHTSQKWTGNSAERSACVPLCWCSCEVQRALCDRLGCCLRLCDADGHVDPVCVSCV